MKLRCAVLVALLGTGTASADDLGIASNLADDNAWTPGVLRARDRGNFVSAATTLDGSRDTDRVQVDALGEAHLFGPVRLIVRVGNVFASGVGDRARPGIGAGVQFLDEARHGVGASAYLQYKTEGFTEPEGEMEAVVAFGKRFGAVRTSLDLAYGQDPEGNERDGEVSIAAQLQPRANLFTGVTARYRDALGSTKEPIVRDGFGGLTSTLAFAKRFAVTAMAGVAMVEVQNAPRGVGPAATVAFGAAF